MAARGASWLAPFGLSGAAHVVTTTTTLPVFCSVSTYLVASTTSSSG